MKQIVNGIVSDMTPEEEAAFLATLPGPPPPPPYRLYKSVLIRRATALEAESLEVILNGEEPWLRMMFNSVEYFVSDDALFTYLFFVLEANLGATRADELLAPETP